MAMQMKKMATAKVVKKMSAMKGMKMSAMKGMKMSAMKAMKAMKVSKTGRKWQVLKGTKSKTKGGLNKKDLTKNKSGKVVSVKKSALGKKSKWMGAVAKARTALKIKGFAAIGGKTKEGQAFLAKARSFYKK